MPVFVTPCVQSSSARQCFFQHLADCVACGLSGAQMGRENRNTGRGNMRENSRGICVTIAWNLRGFVAHTNACKHNENTLRFFHAFFYANVTDVFGEDFTARFHSDFTARFDGLNALTVCYMHVYIYIYDHGCKCVRLYVPVCANQ